MLEILQISFDPSKGENGPFSLTLSGSGRGGGFKKAIGAFSNFYSGKWSLCLLL
jgi:hypothetical protein